MKNKLFLAGVIFLLISIFVFPSFAAGPKVHFPYTTLYLKHPALEEPFPGLGSNYSCLANGMNTALWNPAGLSKVATMEQSISFLQNSPRVSVVSTMELPDQTQTFGDNNEGTLLILFTDDSTETTAITRELNFTTYTDNQGTAINVSQAMKVTDWLHLGFMTKGDFGAGLISAGNLPTMMKYQMDLNNMSMGTGFAISSGKLQYTTGGTTYETSNSLWSGFLNQNSTMPATTHSNLENSLKIENNFVCANLNGVQRPVLGRHPDPPRVTSKVVNFDLYA